MDMKRLSLAALLLVFLCGTTTRETAAQERGVTLKTDYPLTVGDDRFAEVTAHVYTARLGLGYSVALTRSLKVVPEVGAGYTRIDFQADGSAEPERSGPSTWMALNPTYSVADAVGVGVSLGYKAVFLKKPEGLGDSGYNHQLHALMFGATLTYEF